MASIRLPRPHKGQQCVLRGRKRFTWLTAGRRWRKTTLGTTAVLEEMVRNPGKTYLWGAPTFDQARVAWEEAMHACGDLGVFRVSRMEMVLPNGARLFYRSLDQPHNARGITAWGVVLDEVAFINPLAYHEVVRPMISDTGGWVLGLGTPNGRNWFWAECEKAKARMRDLGDESDTVFFQAPTLGVTIRETGLERCPHPLENPEFSFDEAQALFRSMPLQTFEQEFLAAFVESGGAVFRNVELASVLAPDTPHGDHTYVFGVDWAKSYDWTVISVIDVTTGHQVYVERFNQIDYQVQLDRLITLADRWEPDVIVAEENSMGAPLVEALQRWTSPRWPDGLPVIPFTTTYQSKKHIVDALALAMERGTLRLLDHQQQKDELSAFEVQRLPSGIYHYAAPAGVHDDCVMALALALQGAMLTGLPQEGTYVMSDDQRVRISPI